MADAVRSHISRFKLSFPHIQFYNTFAILSKKCELSLADSGFCILVDIHVTGIDLDRYTENTQHHTLLYQLHFPC